LLTAWPMSRFFLLEDEDQEKDDQDESDYPTAYVHRAPPLYRIGNVVPPGREHGTAGRQRQPAYSKLRAVVACGQVAVVLFISSSSANACLILRSASPASSVMS
jgi:hypothetical protein